MHVHFADDDVVARRRKQGTRRGLRKRIHPYPTPDADAALARR